MDRITNKLEETIKSSIDRLDTLDKTSPEYGQLVTNVAKLNEQRLKEAELDAAAISRAEDPSMEDEKMFERQLMRKFHMFFQDLIFERQFSTGVPI